MYDIVQQLNATLAQMQVVVGDVEANNTVGALSLFLCGREDALFEVRS